MTDNPTATANTNASDWVSARARLAGVMGWPISHSQSPRLHGYWLRRYGIDGLYGPLAVAPDSLATALRALPHLGYAGCNLTIPHKRAALPLLDRLTPTAQRIGAVNTVFVEADGTLSGDNTDAAGFLDNLRQGLPHWQPTEAAATVLGAGGAARAVVVALLDAGVPEVRLCNRTVERASDLATEMGAAVSAVPWEHRQRALAESALLVNTTSLGMTGQPALDLDLTALPDTAAVNDIVYTPLETPLLRAAAARRLATVDGLGMLLHQAVPGFARWFGVTPTVDEDLRQHMLAGF